jgi:hypothetical protein
VLARLFKDRVSEGEGVMSVTAPTKQGASTAMSRRPPPSLEPTAPRQQCVDCRRSDPAVGAHVPTDLLISLR